MADEILTQKDGVDRSRIPSRSLESVEIASEVLKYIPEESAKHYGFIPIGLTEGVLQVGVTDPDNLVARDALQFIASRLNLPYKLFIITQGDFEKVLLQYKNLTGEVTQALRELDLNETTKQGPNEGEQVIAQKGASIIEEAPVSKIVSVILNHAIDGNASDIHIEPTTEIIRVKFRVDGVLHTSLTPPRDVHDAIVARIKILTGMKLDEKRKPQDGRFSVRIGERRIDIRVSILPTNYGEKIVMRILDPEKGLKKIEDLGLRGENVEMLRDAIKRPYGMILITGPTGSGKTTTLAAMLNELDREHANVISLEDPIEYNIEGVNQSQIRPEIGYTFASGLRSILRQDPDIIMVGEIRDKETAELAVQAALTGHLVFSTLHTNNATGVVPRLIDMGVDPYLIAPTLILAVAQRLVRVLCPDAKDPIPMTDSTKAIADKIIEDLPERRKKEFQEPKEVFRAGKSKLCPTGTRGRLGVFEMLPIDKDMERLILKGASELDIYKTAREKGMLTMREDALFKAFEGIIPFEEINTV